MDSITAQTLPHRSTPDDAKKPKTWYLVRGSIPENKRCGNQFFVIIHATNATNILSLCPQCHHFQKTQCLMEVEEQKLLEILHAFLL